MIKDDVKITETMSIRIDTKFADKIRSVSNKNRRNISNMIVIILEDHIDKYK